MGQDDRKITDYQFLLQLSNDDKALLTKTANLIIADELRGVAKIDDLDTWVNEQLDKQNSDIFYLLFDFDPQYSRETLLNFEFPTFEMIETLFNKYHDIKNDNHQRCMIWLDILKNQ